MLEKVLTIQTNTEKTLSGLSETVVSHSAAIQNLEQQMRDLSREQHPARKGGLPSDTIPNPKNGGGGVERTFAISTRSGKILQGADKKAVDLDLIIEEEEVHSDVHIVDDEVHVEEKAADIPDVAADTRKQMIKGALCPLTQMYKAKPPFPQRLAKNNDDAKCHKFYDQLKQLTVNFPFLDAVKEMSGFAKFVKDLLMKKRSVQHETVNLTHRVSSIIASTTVQKKGDLGAFTIPCYIGLHAFAHALCENGLMPLAIFKQSGLEMPRTTSMRLQMADRSIKKPVGVIDDVLVQGSKFILPADFVILDCVVDKDIPIILGRPFLLRAERLWTLKRMKSSFE
ncbi:uncharacterized protein LOC132044852 [Lycium ferocissimum]|uniref:uncharacterized protein LOC132044852 n=1 Tax=Lycium ferocissimum TaxID=112874 RepID=UPI002816447C|nr:uncharacterized protein LOC132044852 [Lycium ferocissimum]